MSGPDDLPYLFRWDRCGRKGQPCKVTARGRMNSVRVVFADGFTMITSGNALRKPGSRNGSPAPSTTRTASPSRW